MERTITEHQGLAAPIGWSGWSDLNRRLPASKAGTLTGLSYIQTMCLELAAGFEPATSRSVAECSIQAELCER